MIVRLYADEDGQSHFADLTLSWDRDHRGREQTPLRGATGLEFARLPGGYAAEWHTAPRHAYAIILAGQMACTIGDGTKRRLGPGDILRAEDFTGRGHWNRVLDDESLLVAFVRIDGDGARGVGRREARRNKERLVHGLRAEPGTGAAALQLTLVPRFSFRARLTARASREAFGQH